jgi:RNA polymerase sigma factor (sigma-70 family)
MSETPIQNLEEAYVQLQAIKANDEPALKQLYEENYPKVEKYVLENNGSQDEARDIYQEAFVAVWRNVQLDKFQPRSNTALNGYLYQVAKNKWLDHLGSAHHLKVVPLAESQDYEAEEVPAEDNNFIERVKKELKNLGKNCKDLLTRFYYGAQSLREIAKANKWTEQTARNNKYRCIEKLRNLMKN